MLSIVHTVHVHLIYLSQQLYTTVMEITQKHIYITLVYTEPINKTSTKHQQNINKTSTKQTQIKGNENLFPDHNVQWNFCFKVGDIIITS